MKSYHRSTFPESNKIIDRSYNEKETNTLLCNFSMRLDSQLEWKQVMMQRDWSVLITLELCSDCVR